MGLRESSKYHMEKQDMDNGRGCGQWTRTVDTDKNRRVAINITMIGASLIASTFLVYCTTCAI